MVVYIRTQGAKIVREGRHLLVRKGGDIHHTLFTYKLRQLVLFGNVEITHSAFVHLMRYNVDTVFMSRTGRYLGRIAPPESKNVYLHKRQYALLDDEAFGLRLARCIVAGKLSNMATFLLRIRRSRGDALAGQKASEIQRLMPLLESADQINSIRGYEGRGSALYFEALPRGFIGNLGFSRRVRRPPTDPVNSVLSLLYTFLMNRVYAAVRVAALDPYPGYLHAIDYGRFSLVLDLMEEFRVIIADSLALSLFNLRILKEEDFFTQKPGDERPEESNAAPQPDVSKDPMGLISGSEMDEEIFDLPEQRMEEQATHILAQTGKHPVRLTDEAFRRVIEAFEKKMTTSFYHPLAGRSLTYGEAVLYQAAHYRKVIEGEVQVYQPVLMK